MSSPPNYQTILQDILQLGDAVQGTNGLWAELKADETASGGWKQAVVQLGKYADQLNALTAQLTAAGAPQDIMTAFQATITEIKQAQTDLLNNPSGGVKMAYDDVTKGISGSQALNVLFVNCLHTATQDAFNSLQSAQAAYTAAAASSPTGPATVAAFNNMWSILNGLGTFLQTQIQKRGDTNLAAALGLPTSSIDALVTTDGKGYINTAWNLASNMAPGYNQSNPVAPSTTDYNNLISALTNASYFIV